MPGDIPLVSIVTPSYNQAKYLEFTMRSVLEQGYPRLEYIVVDGGSSDGSQEIIRKYADRLAWWVSEPDAGQADAINKGMAKAQGEIVAWLNSDDILLPEAVSQAVRELEESPQVGMVFGNAITIDANGRPLNKLVFSNWGLKEFIGFRIICQPAVFMRRKYFEEVGGLARDYHFMLDHHLWIRIARLAPVKHAPRFWAAARHHLSAKNVSQAAEFGRETLRVLEWMQTQPDLARLIESNRRYVIAGAQRLNARYLLDGDLFSAALRAYGKALLADPRYTLRHWHRMIYAVLGLIGLKDLRNAYFRLNTRHPGIRWSELGINTWPGLNIGQAG